MIVCPGCGGNLKFDIASQKMHCAYCDNFIEPADVVEKDHDADLDVVNNYSESDNMMEVTIYTCPQCGAELMSSDQEATSFCSYCGAANILTERISKTERPDNIIPFKITKEECKERYAKKLAKTLFAPKELSNPEHIDSFRGIYMPYWFYNIKQDGRASIDGTKEKREGDYRVITHFDLSANVNNRYEGLSHDASKSFADNISESLAPYNTHDAVPFRTAYLSGFYADIADVEQGDYEEEAKRIAAEDAFSNLSREPAFKEYSLKKPEGQNLITRTCTKVSEVNRSMFPVWFLSHRDKDNRVSYAAINGQTGKVTADIPIDKTKYLLASAIMAVVIWGLLCLFNTSSLLEILRDGIIGGTICLIISSYVISCIAEKEKEKSSSPGLLIFLVVFGLIISLVGFWIKIRTAIIAVPVVAYIVLVIMVKKVSDKKYRGTISGLALTIILVISGIIWVSDPAMDAWYYVPQILISLSVIWCFFDTLFYYNRLMSRPLPQFSRSGGDDNA